MAVLDRERWRERKAWHVDEGDMYKVHDENAFIKICSTATTVSYTKAAQIIWPLSFGSTFWPAFYYIELVLLPLHRVTSLTSFPYTISVGQSNSRSQSGTYGTSNTSQLPPQQGINNGSSQTQNGHSPQNGIADTSDPPSASIREFMEFSANREIVELHNAIVRGAQPNGGGETHPAGESASNVSTFSADPYGNIERQELGLPASTGEALQNIPTASMADYMTDQTNMDILSVDSIPSNELAASMGSLRIVQRDGHTTSYTITNGNSTSREDNQPTRLRGYLPQEDPATQHQWQSEWTSDPVRHQNTPLPTPTSPVREDDLPSVYLTDLRLGSRTEERLAAYAHFFGDSSEHEASEEIAASNQADLTPVPRRNPRRRGLARRASLRRTTEADQEFWHECNGPVNDK
ncbi:uncharacterized protein BDR25DRAFT_347512 [Lindgomyces ingoldianus]|uniref:Uncharacterized protein n=1 Tax=Lindgomyces ingoldianus TaxID=673940 RepID=A0ACB6Q7X1_9PLEO|nr:uncharacterized protein BDR25DRAFT_347512 [Lindgomyces ingoldianus]KAF2462947.1 hypothetical protein BDR25DRAFT_347512 [Lindgomyces ingoldianus]